MGGPAMNDEERSSHDPRQRLGLTERVAGTPPPSDTPAEVDVVDPAGHHKSAVPEPPVRWAADESRSASAVASADRDALQTPGARDRAAGARASARPVNVPGLREDPAPGTAVYSNAAVPTSTPGAQTPGAEATCGPGPRNPGDAVTAPGQFGRERTRFAFVGCDCEPECVVQYVISGAPRDSDALAESVPDWVLAYVTDRHAPARRSRWTRLLERLHLGPDDAAGGRATGRGDWEL